MAKWQRPANLEPMFLLAEATQVQGANLLSYIILAVMGIAAALLLYCIFTIHKNPYFNEVQKLGWLLIALVCPIVWIIRARLEKKFSQSDDT